MLIIRLLVIWVVVGMTVRLIIIETLLYHIEVFLASQVDEIIMVFFVVFFV